MLYKAQLIFTILVSIMAGKTGKENILPCGKNLTVLQWNCRSLNKNILYLTQFLSQNKCDVLCIQSPLCYFNKLPNLEGFYYPPVIDLKDKGKWLKVVTYIKCGLSYEAIKSPVTPNPLGHSCAVQIPSKYGKKINLVNVYYPKGCSKIEDSAWLTELNENAGHWMIVGDFNDHHNMWDPYVKNKTSHLADNINNSLLQLLNDGSVTRIPDVHNHKPSAIDLSLVSTDIYLNSDWTVFPDTLQSDHLAILITLYNIDPGHENKNRKAEYNYNLADWSLFQQLLQKPSAEDVQDNDIEIYYNNLRNCIIDAADRSIPKKTFKKFTGKTQPASWWNEECQEAIDNKRLITQRFLKNQNNINYDLMKHHQRNCSKVTAQAKLKDWSNFVSENITSYRDSSKVWKKIKQHKGRFKLPDKPLNDNGRLTVGDRDKADVLAETFSRVSKLKYMEPDKLHFRTEMEKDFKHPEPDNSNPINCAMSVSECGKAIKQIKQAKKAPGSCRISYSMIKQLPNHFVSILTDFFNTCWKNDKIPIAWKQAQVVAIPKVGKPKNLPSSYRPISLTPHLGKIYERIIKNRMEYFLDKNNIIPPCQAGFRKGRSCTDHVVRLVEKMKKTLTSKNKTLLTTFFDVKKAYDTVWHARLLVKIQRLGITGHTYNFIKDFITGRSMQVKVGDALSYPHPLEMGVPQGSIIAPILFSVMLHDIDLVDVKGATVLLYADDMVIIDTQKPRIYNKTEPKMNPFQTKVNNLIDYMHLNGFDLSADKTVFMVVSRHKVLLDNCRLTVGDIKLKPSKTVKFLGVVIHRNLLWGPHINHLVEKANKVISVIKFLRAEPWARGQKFLTDIVKALVRSRLTYGQEAFFAAPKSDLKLLETVELKALKIALNIPRSANNKATYDEVGWLSLAEERKLRATQYVLRATATDSNPTNEVLTDDFTQFNNIKYTWLREKSQRQYDKIYPIWEYAKPILKKVNLETEDIVRHNAPMHPPWLLEIPSIADSLPIDLKKSDNPLLAGSVAKELINTKYVHFLKVYTDGSKLSDGSVGCAFVIPDLQITKRFKLNDGVSIFTAELFAIYMALSYVNDLTNKPFAVVVCTDSKSSLQALQSETKNRSEIQTEIKFLAHQIIITGTELQLQYVPSHTGIRGNDLADCAAKEAALLHKQFVINLKVSLSEASSKIINLLNKEQNQGEERDRFPVLPLSLLTMFRKIRTNSCLYTFIKPLCACGELVNFHHIFTACPHTTYFHRLHEHIKTLNLTPTQCLHHHKDLGWSHVKLVCKTIYTSPLGKWF